jgi:hopanoid biosynthesis associated RND transporter like protein HpnN
MRLPKASYRVLGDLICRWPLLFVMLGLLLATSAGIYAVRSLKFKTSRNDLIGRDSEYWRLYSEYAREFRDEEDYIVVVESDKPDRNRAAVDALVNALLAPANNPHKADAKDAQQFTVPDVFARVNFEPMQQWFLYYLSTNDLVEIRDSLREFNQLVTVLQNQPKLATFLDSMNQMLQQMDSASDAERKRMLAFVPTITATVKQMADYNPAAEKWQLLSPWANAFFSEEMVGQAEDAMKWGGYHVFRKGKMYIVLIHPRLSGKIASPEHHAATVPKLNRIIKEVRPQFGDVRITLTGEPVLDNDEMVVSEHDTIKSSILTLILIGIVIVAGFRDWLRMLLSICCLIQVIIVSMGYATLAIGHLNIITITFTVMILGLGEDLGVQFISRYEEELSKGADRFDAVRGAVRWTGPSIVTAGITNAAAFFAMALSGFKGVIELGVIAGGGMLLATVGMVMLLPSLMLVIRRKKERIPRLVNVPSPPAERALLARPRVTLAVCGGATLIALVLAWQAQFDSNVLHLQSLGLESVETEMRLLKADAESTIYAAVVAENLDETRALQSKLGKLPSVAAVHSIAELIPEQQAEKVPLIREIRKRVGNVRFNVPEFAASDAAEVQRALGSVRLRASRMMREAKERNDDGAGMTFALLAETSKAAREKLQTLNPADLERWLGQYQKGFYSDLQAQLTLLAGQAERPMGLTDVPEDIGRMLIGKSGKKFLLRVFPKENIWDRDELERFVGDVCSIAPKATGTPLGLYEFVGILKSGYIKAALWAFVVIAIMVFLDLRGWLATLFTLVPLMFGIVWMMGAMTALGISFNPANVLTLPLMVGIGVAYGVYFVQRYREDGEAAFWGKSTGRAVMLSALTAIIAFSSMLIGSHRGICSLGLIMSLGVVTCLIASLTLLPALLEIARRRGWKV